LQKATKRYPNIAIVTTIKCKNHQKAKNKISTFGNTIYPEGRSFYNFQDVKELYIIQIKIFKNQPKKTKVETNIKFSMSQNYKT
jgi:D-alanyl-lipoteichoic acid acyltransferase DltB (MBOAT superfamily)